MVDNKEFLNRIRVPEDGSPNFAEEYLLEREFADMEKNPDKYVDKKSKIKNQNNKEKQIDSSYYDGPFELENFLLEMEELGLFDDTKRIKSKNGSKGDDSDLSK